MNCHLDIYGVVFCTLFIICHGAKDLLNHHTVCLTSESVLALSCPAEHALSIEDAHYYRAQEPGCRTNGYHEDNVHFCKVADVSKSLFLDCYPQTSCRIDLQQRLQSTNNAQCAGYAGDIFLAVSYKCYPSANDNGVNMCNTVENWEGSFLYIWSPLFPTMSVNHGCTCTISMEEELNMEVRIPDFEHGAESQDTVRRHPCSQSISFWTDYGREKVCAESVDSGKSLEFLKGKEFHIEYHNPLGVTSRYIIMLHVHHDYKFSISCSPNISISAPTTPPQPSLPRTPGTIPMSFTGEPNAGTPNPLTAKMAGNNKIWPLVGGTLAGLLVVAIIIVLSVWFYKRRKREQHQKQCSQEMNQNAFENNVYMRANEVPRQNADQGQSQTEPQGQGQGQEESGASGGVVSFDTLPEKTGLDHFRYHNEEHDDKSDKEEEFDEITLSESNDNNETITTRPVSVRDRARNFEPSP